MKVTPDENNSFTKEIESWKNGFAFALRAEDRELFMEMLEDCCFVARIRY
jgi:hypothetical protein